MVDLFDKYTNAVSETDPIKFTGRVVRVHDKLIESEGPVASVGELCQIITDDNPDGLKGELKRNYRSAYELYRCARCKNR